MQNWIKWESIFVDYELPRNRNQAGQKKRWNCTRKASSAFGEKKDFQNGTEKSKPKNIDFPNGKSVFVTDEFTNYYDVNIGI